MKTIRCFGYSVNRPIIEEILDPMTGELLSVFFAGYQIYWWLDELMQQHRETVEDSEPQPKFKVLSMGKDKALLIRAAGDFTVFSGRGAEAMARDESLIDL